MKKLAPYAAWLACVVSASAAAHLFFTTYPKVFLVSLWLFAVSWGLLMFHLSLTRGGDRD